MDDATTQAPKKRERLRAPLFREFVSALGFNSQTGIHRAGAKIGLGRFKAHARSSGEVEIGLTERLAMTAVIFDLPPFSGAVYECLDDRTKYAFAVARSELQRALKEHEAANARDEHGEAAV